MAYRRSTSRRRAPARRTYARRAPARRAPARRRATTRRAAPRRRAAAPREQVVRLVLNMNPTQAMPGAYEKPAPKPKRARIGSGS